MQNVLTHETGRMTCVDLFGEEESQGSFDTTGRDSSAMSTEDRFEHNVRQRSRPCSGWMTARIYRAAAVPGRFPPST